MISSSSQKEKKASYKDRLNFIQKLYNYYILKSMEEVYLKTECLEMICAERFKIMLASDCY